MIDNIAWFLKIVFAVFGVWKIHQDSDLKYIVFLAIPFFMTGAEMVTDSETPWQFLLSASATIGDYEKASFGGMLMVALPFILFVVAGKDILKIIEVGAKVKEYE